MTKPAMYLSRWIILEVTKHLYGKKVGDVIEVPIDTTQLYGERDESLVFTDAIENVPEEYHEIEMFLRNIMKLVQPSPWKMKRVNPKVL